VRTRAQAHNLWGEIYPCAAGRTTINANFANLENWAERRAGHNALVLV